MMHEQEIPEWPRGHYPLETLPADEDDGTMPENVATLADAVVGHKIIKAEKGTRPVKHWYMRKARDMSGLVLTLDNGKEVILVDNGDCCAYTDLDGFFAKPEMVDHVITGVGTTEGYQKWHILADWGDVLELNVSWSCGNPFWYAYGFEIAVLEVSA